MNDHEQRTAAPDGRPPNEQPAWRSEFPIDVPQDNYVARRDFTKFVVLTSLAFVAGQLWIAVENWFRRRRGQPPAIEVAKLSQLPVGGSRTFTYPTKDDPCLLLRPDDKTLLAYAQKCTHLSCAVVPAMERDCIDCPCHKGTFDLRTGRPISGPPRRPLSRIIVEERDGIVYATGVELRTV